MDSKRQLELNSELDKELESILKSKGADYGSEDILSNFKQVSSIVETLKLDITKPEGYAMLLVLLKIARICNLKAKGSTPQNESLQDSYKDLINYTKLAYFCEVDSEK